MGIGGYISNLTMLCTLNYILSSYDIIYTHIHNHVRDTSYLMGKQWKNSNKGQEQGKDAFYFYYFLTLHWRNYPMQSEKGKQTEVYKLEKKYKTIQ